jgi:hypothetical protein
MDTMIGAYAVHIAISAVDVLEGYKLRIYFNNGDVRIFDMAAHRERYQGPIFRPIWEDPDEFATAYVDSESVAWSCGADIAPERLYELSQPQPDQVAHDVGALTNML